MLLSRISSVEFKTEDIASFARQLSLILVGIIILSSIRMVLRGATRALHITSRNLAASLMLLSLAQIMVRAYLGHCDRHGKLFIDVAIPGYLSAIDHRPDALVLPTTTVVRLR